MTKTPVISDTYLHSTSIETPLGTMVAIANDSALILLQFTDKARLEDEISRVENSTNMPVMIRKNTIIFSIEHELDTYFKGESKVFKTPLQFIGTAFQQRAWNALCAIPYGKTKSYAAQASDIDQPTAYRAVANANGANHLCIVVPCHRIIASSGTLGGYSSGIHRKKWLLEHENKFSKHTTRT